MYIIYVGSEKKYFCKDHNKIITFKDLNKAKWFLNQFLNSATIQISSDIILASKFSSIINSIRIILLPESIKAETIDFDKL